MRSVAAVVLGILVLFAAAFGIEYTLTALSVSNRGLTGPAYTVVTWGAGLSGHALAGYAASLAGGRAPYAHAIGVGVVVTGLIFGAYLLEGVGSWWTVQAASINVLHFPGLLVGAWIASQRGV